MARLIAMEWREKLRRLLKDKNAAELSRTVGLNPSAIGAAASKGNLPKADKAVRIARALRVPTDWLFNDEAGWPPPERASGGEGLGDFELAEELARRRALVIRDIEAIARRFSDRKTKRELEAIAERAWKGEFDKLAVDQQRVLKSADSDIQRLGFLMHRLELMDPSREETRRSNLTPEEVLGDCPACAKLFLQRRPQNEAALLHRYVPGQFSTHLGASNPPRTAGDFAVSDELERIKTEKIESAKRYRKLMLKTRESSESGAKTGRKRK